MIKHMVMWKLKDEAEGNQKDKNALILKEKLEDLKGKIDGLLHIEVGIDFSKTENSSDVVLYSEFETKEALVAYQEHPLHIQAGSFVRGVVAERRLVDFEI